MKKRKQKKKKGKQSLTQRRQSFFAVFFFRKGRWSLGHTVRPQGEYDDAQRDPQRVVQQRESCVPIGGNNGLAPLENGTDEYMKREAGLKVE